MMVLALRAVTRCLGYRIFSRRVSSPWLTGGADRSPRGETGETGETVATVATASAAAPGRRILASAAN